MSEARAPRGDEWAIAVDALNGLGNALAVRSHYFEGHTAIRRADEATASSFSRLLDQLPELVVALIDGEMVVCERPMPELRERLSAVTSAMARHEVECIVFQRGITQSECALLARVLATPEKSQKAGAARAAQGELQHVLLRYADLRSQDDERRHGESRFFVTDVRAMLDAVSHTLATDGTLDVALVRAEATRIFEACAARSFRLEQRCVGANEANEQRAAHATNVAMMTGAMALAARYAQSACIDVTAAALLHDIGHLAMPDEIRNVPEPLLDAAAKATAQNHSFVGARMLLGAACPPLWIAAALEHHRGVDGKGYPELPAASAPHELVRFVAISNFVDCKRARIANGARDDDRRLSDDPAESARTLAKLANRYFAPADVAVFTQALGVFPPGTTVELSDRQVAIVTQASANDPLRPQVEILCGPNARKRVDLKQLNANEDRHVLSITRAVPPPLVLRDVETEALPVLIEEPPESLPVGSIPAPALPTQIAVVAASVSAPDGEDESIPLEALAAQDMEAMYRERLGSLDRAPSLRVSMQQLTKLTLDHRAGFVVSLIDGATPAEVVVTLSGLPTLDVLRILDDLLQQGAISFE